MKFVFVTIGLVFFLSVTNNTIAQAQTSNLGHVDWSYFSDGVFSDN
jgi:hypothetical protein